MTPFGTFDRTASNGFIIIQKTGLLKRSVAFNQAGTGMLLTYYLLETEAESEVALKSTASASPVVGEYRRWRDQRQRDSMG